MEADPHDVEVRFRLRRGAALGGPRRDVDRRRRRPSSAKRSANIRKSGRTGQRSRRPAAEVGVGYGFALANLAQTIRETNLADLDDGQHGRGARRLGAGDARARGGEGDLNATMIEAGAASGDSTFVDGWYRMSSYGWAIGFLSGLVNVESGGETGHEVRSRRRRSLRSAAPRAGRGNRRHTDAETLCRAESDGNPSDAARALPAGAGDQRRSQPRGGILSAREDRG